MVKPDQLQILDFTSTRKSVPRFVSLPVGVSVCLISRITKQQILLRSGTNRNNL